MPKKQSSLPFFHPAWLIATFMGVGKIPFMPGTWGSLAATICIAIFIILPALDVIPKDWLLPLACLITLATFVKGVWASNVYMKHSGTHDPSEIVIDEVAGMFLTALLAALLYIPLYQYDQDQFMPLLALSPFYLIALLILFRVFDIWKPGFIRVVDESVKGGMGVMLDDIVAALYAVIVFYGLFFILLWTGGFVWIIGMIYPDLLQARP